MKNVPFVLYNNIGIMFGKLERLTVGYILDVIGNKSLEIYFDEK